MATAEQTAVHGGRLVAQALKSRGVSKLFTLSGGHLFSIFDGCKAEGIDVIDTRHEQAAASPRSAGRRRPASRASPPSPPAAG